MDRRKMIAWLRRTMVPGLAITAAVWGLRYALRGLDWQTFRTQLGSLDWRWLAVAVLFDIASYVAQGVRWRMLLQRATLWQTVRAIYAGLLLNEMLPFRPGEAVRAWLAARDLGMTVWQVLPTIVLERLMDGCWLGVCLFPGMWFAPLPQAVTSAARLVVLAAAASFMFAWVLGQTGPRVRAVTAKIARPGPLIVSGAFLASQGVAFWCVGRASHLPLGIAGAFVLMLVVRIGTLLPGAPANIGTHQFSTVLGLSLYGVTGSRAASFSLVLFTVLTVPLCVLGMLALAASGVTWRSVHKTMFTTPLTDDAVSSIPTGAGIAV